MKCSVSTYKKDRNGNVRFEALRAMNMKSGLLGCDTLRVW